MRLKNKIALITGGASGIGLATVKCFTEEGAQVIIIDSNETVGEQLIQQFPLAKFFAVNVSDQQQVQRMINKVLQIIWTY